MYLHDELGIYFQTLEATLCLSFCYCNVMSDRLDVKHPAQDTTIVAVQANKQQITRTSEQYTTDE
jgi:hypothetical protein